jgi:uncharacterized protein YjbI with pentapeptide repeats
MSGADAVDSNFNLAELRVSAKRARFLGAYMIGTKGLTPRNANEADFSYATFVPQPTEGKPKNPSDILKSALSARFIDARQGETSPHKNAVVYTDMQVRSALQSGRIAEGQVWVGGDLNDTRFVGLELSSSILDDIGLQRVRFAGLKAAGLITRQCDLDNIDALGSWAPGSVHLTPNLNSADISGGNWAGSVLVGPSLRGIVANDTNMDGAVIISNNSQRQLEEQVKGGRIAVVKPTDLSGPVYKLLAKRSAKSLGSGVSAAKQIENT